MADDENGRIRRTVTFDENMDRDPYESEEDDDSGLDDSEYDDEEELDGESSDRDDDLEFSKKLSQKVLIYSSSAYLSCHK